MMVIKIITKIIGCILLFIASYVWAAMEIRMDEKIPKKKTGKFKICGEYCADDFSNV